MKSGRLRRSVAAAVLVTLSAAGLTGCQTPFAASDRGATEAEVAAALKSTPLASTTVETSSSLSGLTERRFVTVIVELDEGTRVMDTSAVLTYLAQLAWAIGEEEPNDGITFYLPLDFDEAAVSASLEDLSWSAQADALIPYLPARKAAEIYGPWPSEVPPWPEGALGP